MKVHSVLRSDLRRILLGVADLPTAVAWEGQRFETVQGQRWMNERLVPLTRDTDTLGNAGYTLSTLNYELTLFDPPVTGGLSEIEDLADSITFAFPAGRGIGLNEVQGRVLRSGRHAARTHGDFRQIPVFTTVYVRYRTQGARND